MTQASDNAISPDTLMLAYITPGEWSIRFIYELDFSSVIADNISKFQFPNSVVAFAIIGYKSRINEKNK